MAHLKREKKNRLQITFCELNLASEACMCVPVKMVCEKCAYTRSQIKCILS